MISVIVPTITGREHWLDKCLQSYLRHHPDAQIIVVLDRPTCGEAWAIGAESAKGDYLHFTADDIELFAPLNQACKVAASGRIPSPVVLNSDGSTQSIGAVFGGPYPADREPCPFTTVPLVTRAQYDTIGPCPSIHYGSDVWFTEQGAKHGWQTVACHGYRVIHHMAPEGRLHAGAEGGKAAQTVQGPDLTFHACCGLWTSEDAEDHAEPGRCAADELAAAAGWAA